MDRLKTAVLGLNNSAELFLKAACQSQYLQIQAIADKDTARVEKAAAKYNCQPYDDYRQLITQNQFDCLLVAAPIHSCGEYIRAAMKKKFHILKSAPPARNFEEAAELISLAESRQIEFAVANTSRFCRSFHALKQMLGQGQIEQIFLAAAICNSADQSIPAWQSDPEVAGGGVLLYNCYQMIDQLVCSFGMPQLVYAVNTNIAADRQQRHYRTEDTAVVTLKFSDAFSCSILASRLPAVPALATETLSTQQDFLKVFGKEKILTASSNSFIVSDHLGQIQENSQYSDEPISCMKKLLDNFAQRIIEPETNKLYCSAKDNLENMAVIDSAYLSARTAMPEEPARILQITPLEIQMQKDLWQNQQ
ncbi:MAG: Gfo/Idh/MocA family protein [Planctomycetota bacterium]|jgi:predicted dehydrogenase